MAKRLRLEEVVREVENWSSDNDESSSDSESSADENSGEASDESSSDLTDPGNPTSPWNECPNGTLYATHNDYPFNPRKKPGICAQGITPGCDVFTCFNSVFSEDIMSDMVDMINAYAALKIQINTPARRRSLFHDWKDVTLGELYKFFAVLISMSLDKRPGIKDYWSTSEHFHTSFYGQLFLRERFESIYFSMLHVGEPNSPGCEKIEPFMKNLISEFQAAFYPFKEVSIDEMTVGCKGRFRYKQYNPMKPKKHHIKVFGLCDSSTGYVYNLFPYFGSKTSFVIPEQYLGQSVKVFNTLLQPLDTGHHVFADRYYTSYELLKFMRDKSFHYTGTLQTNRKGFPDEVKKNKLGHRESKFFKSAQDGDMVCVIWRDKKAKKPCVLVSTNADNSNADVQRKREVVEMPALIHKYNSCMNGCDRSDQMVSYFGTHERRSKKWWKKLYHWMFEVAQLNAFILFRLSRKKQNKTISFKQFKSKLIQSFQQQVVQHHRGDILQRKSPGRPRLVQMERYTQKQHIIQYVQQDRNCVYCSSANTRKRTNYICSSCSVHPHLHPKDCFEKYHKE